MTRLTLVRQPKKRAAIGQPLWPDAVEADLSDLVRLHLSFLPWCRFWINKERFMSRGDGTSAFVPGLAEGSGDLVGLVQRPIIALHEDRVMLRKNVGIFTSIELKHPTRSRTPSSEQLEWMGVVNRLDGVAGWTRTLFGVFEIISRARGCTIFAITDEIQAITGTEVVDS